VQKCNIQKRGDRFLCYDKFAVADISYNDNREIVGLTIVNEDTGEVVFTMYPKKSKKIPPSANDIQLAEFDYELMRTGVAIETVLSRYNVSSVEEMTPEMLSNAISSLKRTKTKSA
jgi:hypothetical protein